MAFLTKLFWLDALERSIKATANSLVMVFVVGDKVVDLFTLEWKAVLGLALGAGVVSILMSIASAKTAGGDNTASLVVATKPK